MGRVRFHFYRSQTSTIYQNRIRSYRDVQSLGYGHQAIDWIAEFLEHVERYPVLPPVKPGELTSPGLLTALNENQPLQRQCYRYPLAPQHQ
jgi:hypothetical protein